MLACAFEYAHLGMSHLSWAEFDDSRMVSNWQAAYCITSGSSTRYMQEEIQAPYLKSTELVIKLGND